MRYHLNAFGCHIGPDGWTYLTDDFGNAIEIDGDMANQSFEFFAGTNEGTSFYVPSIL